MLSDMFPVYDRQLLQFQLQKGIRIYNPAKHL